MKLGFIGLGIMGTPMALRLAKAGHALHVTTIGPVADELLKHGSQHLACAEQVAEQSDIIFIMVPDTPQVAEVHESLREQIGAVTLDELPKPLPLLRIADAFEH